MLTPVWRLRGFCHYSARRQPACGDVRAFGTDTEHSTAQLALPIAVQSLDHGQARGACTCQPPASQPGIQAGRQPEPSLIATPVSAPQDVPTLDLLSELKRRLESPPGKNIILVGPPGSGKGTQVHAAAP